MPKTIPKLADPATIQEAANLLRQGRLVAFPTETVYGLGADASNPEAVNKIFSAKGRPVDHPLIVHIADPIQLSDWAVDIPEAAYQLAKQFWPGPLALILNKKPSVPLAVTGGQNTVAVRIPQHPVALQLLQSFGGGVAAPSANRYCRISPTTAQHVLEELGDAVDFILDGGACAVGVESTIIDLSGTQPRLLRPGHIRYPQIEAILNTPVKLPEMTTNDSESAASTLRAPGMMALHYAPETKALLCSADELSARIKTLQATTQHIGLLCYQSSINANSKLTIITLPAQADAYAQGLYAALRQLDELKLDLLLIECPPDNEAWRAVNDRLHKATARY